MRTLEIIGEAAKKISNELKKQNPSVKRKSISDLRNRLIHDCSGIYLDVIEGMIEEVSMRPSMK